MLITGAIPVPPDFIHIEIEGIEGTHDFLVTPQERFLLIYAAYDTYGLTRSRLKTRCQCGYCPPDAQSACPDPSGTIGGIPIDDIGMNALSNGTGLEDY